MQYAFQLGAAYAMFLISRNTQIETIYREQLNKALALYRSAEYGWTNEQDISLLEEGIALLSEAEIMRQMRRFA